jgi:hypothetical protein
MIVSFNSLNSMRMWMIDPATMCRRHLLGEHVECHMISGTINKGKGIQGYLDKGLIETHSLVSRHAELAGEMLKRGYRHNSPLVFRTQAGSGKVDRAASEADLRSRCQECRTLKQRLDHGTKKVRGPRL